MTVTDPKALENAAKRLSGLQYEPDLGAAMASADTLLLLTEWQQYKELDPFEVSGGVAGLRILDGRNVLDAAKWRAAEWHYRGLGRP